MKAVVCTAYGAPEVLRITEVEKPLPKRNEILIKIKATAVNSGDVRVRSLQVEGFLRIIMRFVLGFTKPRKPILGTVLSGIVEEVGSDVTSFKKGDEVYATTGFKFGTYAEYIVLPESATITHKPVNATFEESAAVLFGGTSALYFLNKAGIMLAPNQRILIYGATGSVGIAAVEIAKHYKAHVTSVCSEQGIELATKAGSDDVILYTRQDVTSRNSTYDVIFDAVGKISKQACKNILKPGGRFITVGGMDVAKETKDHLQILKELYETGQIHSYIDRVYPIDSILEAHTYVDTNRKKGNVVVTV